jgi:hypothetical protein
MTMMFQNNGRTRRSTNRILPILEVKEQIIEDEYGDEPI